jgi:asparagine synthetase B (glutamine-hydrolysing)
MCGLCGELSFDGRAEVGAIAAMTDRQSNRGPDAAGIFLQDGMGNGTDAEGPLQALAIGPA